MTDTTAAPIDAPATPSSASSPAAATAAPAVAPTPPAAPAAPIPAPQTDEGKEPHWLPDRLRRTEEAARKALLRELGVEDPKDAKKALADYKARVEAEKSELQKAQERAAALEATAKQAEVYKAKVETWAKAEFDKLTESQKAAVERLAGDDPLKRADAIEVLRPTWAVAVPAQAPAAAPTAAPAPAAPPPVPAPATIAPPTGAPRPAEAQTAYEKFVEIERTQGPIVAQFFYAANERAIEASRPIA